MKLSKAKIDENIKRYYKSANNLKKFPDAWCSVIVLDTVKGELGFISRKNSEEITSIVEKNKLAVIMPYHELLTYYRQYSNGFLTYAGLIDKIHDVILERMS